MASQAPVGKDKNAADWARLLKDKFELSKKVFQQEIKIYEIQKKHNERIARLKKLLLCEKYEDKGLEQCIYELWPSEGTSSCEDEEHDDSSKDISSSEDEEQKTPEEYSELLAQYDEVSGEYNAISDQIIENRWCNEGESNVECLQRRSEEYDKLKEQSRSLSMENTGLSQENIALAAKLRGEEYKLRIKERECENVERANARLTKGKDKLKSEVKKLKGGLPELHKLLGCGGDNKLIIPCAEKYIEEHRSTKEKNEQLKSQLRLASYKFKCKDGETPEDCFERKSIIDTIDLENAMGALACQTGEKLADCANRFAEKNKKELKKTTETSPRATAPLDDFTAEEVLTQLEKVHTLGCLALPFTLPLFVARF